MPLSEHEQRLLEQMERALSAEDPKFASALRGSDLRGRFRRRALLGVLGLLVGVTLLLVGVASKQTAVAVLGFLVMLGSALWGVVNWRRIPGPGEIATPPTGRAAKQPRAKVMDRFEERWRRRREEGGR